MPGLFCIFLRLIAVALVNLPQAVILPRQYMVRIGFQRALIPDLREFSRRACDRNSRSD